MSRVSTIVGRLFLMATMGASSTMFAIDVRPNDPPAGAESGMPYLTKSPAGKIFMSWVDTLGSGNGHSLRFSQWTGNGWTPAETISTGRNWFANWADAPTITALGSGAMLAHWLDRFPGGGTYGYGIRVAMRSATEPRWKEVHGMGLQHKSDYAGFLSFVPGEAKAVYLSPSTHAEAHHASTPSSSGHDDHEGGHIKTLRYIAFDGDGASITSDLEIDADTCTCCPTAIAKTPKGLIAAYRDHQPGEIRDISLIREVNGRWTQPATVHADGWKIKGCPTEGPALASDAATVGVAWLTRAGGVSKVQFAVSTNNGETFAAPLRLDSGNPLGRPALVRIGKGSFAAIWVEKVSVDQNELRLRSILPDGTLTAPQVVAKVPVGRLVGIPRLITAGQDLLIAWRDQKVRAAIVTLAPASDKSTKGKK